MKGNIEFEKKINFLMMSISYLLSAFTGVLWYFDLIAIRSLLMVIVLSSHITPWAYDAFDKFGILVLGIIWLSLVVFCISYYEKGVYNRRLWLNFLLITSIELLLISAIEIILLLFRTNLFEFKYDIIGLPICIIVGLILLYVSIRHKHV